MKKYTKKLIVVLVFSLPFCLLFGLPYLELSGKKELKIPITSSEETVLLYFGYPGCSKSCPSTLAKLSVAFDQHSVQSIELMFINILKENNDETTENYANSFHKSFTSPALDYTQRLSLMKIFNIEEQQTSKPDLNHSNFLFLLKKKNQEGWVLQKAFPDIDSYLIYLNERDSND